MDYSQMSDAEISREIYNRRSSARMYYASDMNAAVELLRECQGEFGWDGEKWHVEVSGFLYAGNGNPARAICEVWLQWRNVVDGHG